MRITVRTTPAGEKFMTRFPEFDYSIEEMCTDGIFDESKVRAALKGWQDAGYLMWGNDSRGVIAFTVEFLSQLSQVTRYVENDASTDAHCNINSEADARLERRFDRGMFAYTRFDITSRSDGIRVRVSCDNPRNVPGTALTSARRFGVYACRILLYIKRCIEADKKVNITLEGVGDMSDIFDEAEWTDRKMEAMDNVQELNSERVNCKNRCGDFCSPIDPKCPCYRDGRCNAAELPEEFKEYRGV